MSKESTMPTKREERGVSGTREEAKMMTPAVDIFEIEDGLAVVADMPGVDKEAVDVRVENDVLTITGKAETKAGGDSLYREFGLTNYFRQFQLTNHVDQDKIRAEMKYGVLTIKLPTAEKAKPKKINVNIS